MEDYDIVMVMARYGGSFVVSLAKCWLAADSINRLKLKATFHDYWKRYEEMAELEAKRG